MEATPELTRAIGGLKRDLDSNSVISSKKLAERTLSYLEDTLKSISTTKKLKEAIQIVKNHSEVLQKAAANMVKDDSHTFEVIIQNLTRRVLKIIRDDLDGANEEEDLYDRSILTYKAFFGNAITDPNEECSRELSCCTLGDRLDNILGLIEEIQTGLESIEECICKSAMDHIKPGIILTVDYDRSVLEVLRKAHEKYQKDPIQVVVIEGMNGRKMYTQLKKIGVNTTLVPDSNVHVILNQGVDIVFIGAQLVLADGSCRVSSGTHTISAMCAKSKNIPVIITAGSHTFTPAFPADIPIFIGNTISVIDNGDHELTHPLEPQDIIIPASDDISADCISFFVTDENQVAPSFVYRKLADMYHIDDY